MYYRGLVASELARVGEAQVAQAFGRLVAKSVAVVEVVDRTYEIPRDEAGELVRPDGMKDADWNLHCDAMKTGKNVPVYLTSHLNRVELAQKIAGHRGEAPPIAAYVVHTVAMQKYPVVDVSVEAEERR